MVVLRGKVSQFQYHQQRSYLTILVPGVSLAPLSAVISMAHKPTV